MPLATNDQERIDELQRRIDSGTLSVAEAKRSKEEIKELQAKQTAGSVPPNPPRQARVTNPKPAQPKEEFKKPELSLEEQVDELRKVTVPGMLKNAYYRDGSVYSFDNQIDKNDKKLKENTDAIASAQKEIERLNQENAELNKQSSDIDAAKPKDYSDETSYPRGETPEQRAAVPANKTANTETRAKISALETRINSGTVREPELSSLKRQVNTLKAQLK